MLRWFLSYNSQDFDLVQRIETALRRKKPEAHIFFAAKSLRAGGYWLPELAKEIAEATAFILLVGEKGLGAWQVAEYYEALDRRVKENSFPLVLVLLDGQAAPGLPFLRQLHWIVTADPASEHSIARVMAAASGSGSLPGELWRYTSPYRGLAAMTEIDSDFFFGREDETVEVLSVIASAPDRLTLLLGNSGVGKSSLAQAGVLAALKRQAWPERAGSTADWPRAFQESRLWCYLKLQPGTEPLKTIVETFLETWQFDAGDPGRIKHRNEWVELLLDDKRKTSLIDLLNETERRYQELNRPKPPAFFLYVDQGEELYVRADNRQRRRFSSLIAESLGDPRLHVVMSLRADFFGELQRDEALFRAHRLINVPPLREKQLRDVVGCPAELLSARFETEHLSEDIARRTAEESTKDAGALPLLSYLLDDMWTAMVRRGDGLLRLPAAAMELGGVLAERANAFISNHPQSENTLRHIFTLKLATVREDGEPTRRRAPRSEFTEEEWRLVSELADHPNRLLVTATLENGQTYAEVAHEAVFRRWGKLREWVAQEREFLAWRSGLEADRRGWQAAPDHSKADALLMGLALDKAQSWIANRPDDIPDTDREFIALSVRSERRRKRRIATMVGVLAVCIMAALFGWANHTYLQDQWRWFATTRPYMLAEFRPHVLPLEREQGLKGTEWFRECVRDCPEMIVVPAGEFVMGSPITEEGRSSREGPQHRVLFARPFAVSKFEVTFAEWDACVAYGDCDSRLSDSGWGRGRQPVVYVSWDDAQRYVAWLNRMTGKERDRGYRLLSEAEWEYAARAGTQTRFFWGDGLGKSNANCKDCGSQWDNKQAAPVGSFPPNAFGLHDVHGNVWEWVEDCYHGNYNNAPTDGSAWTTGGDCTNRVVRGASWFSLSELVRSAHRNRYPVGYRRDIVGFRVGRTLDR
jgi:formylglycine-generating enzyme required for sulfatase activity